MMAKEKKEPVQQEQVQSNGKQRNLLLIVLILLLSCILLGGAFAGYYFIVAPRAAERPPEILTTAPIDFVVNLADNSPRRYLKASVQLGFTQKKLRGELERKSAEIRDAIIEVFRSRTSADIGTVEGTNEVRRELLEKINERLVSGEVVKIYFTDFIIQ